MLVSEILIKVNNNNELKIHTNTNIIEQQINLLQDARRISDLKELKYSSIANSRLKRNIDNINVGQSMSFVNKKMELVINASKRERDNERENLIDLVFLANNINLISDKILLKVGNDDKYINLSDFLTFVKMTVEPVDGVRDEVSRNKKYPKNIDCITYKIVDDNENNVIRIDYNKEGILKFITVSSRRKINE